MIQLQLQDMKEVTNVTFHNIEHDFTYSEGIYPSRKRPEYWDGLGSSKSRTEQQVDMSREVISNMLLTVDIGTIVAFTDGSCQPNPGPCGAGSCLFFPHERNPVKLTKPVSNMGSILLGELVAILMTLQYIMLNLPKTPGLTNCLIMSDSQSAVGILTLGWESTNYKQTVKDTMVAIKDLQDRGVETKIEWTPGHANIEGNEIADLLAKEAATAAAELDPSTSVTTFDDIKQAAHKTGVAKWQHQWDSSERGRHFFKLKSRVDTKIPLDYPDKTSGKKISELRLGYSRLKGYTHAIGVSESNKCSCGEVETVEHFLLECRNYVDAREHLRKELWKLTGSLDLTTETVLHTDQKTEQNDTPTLDIKTCFELLAKFIAKTSRFDI